MKLFPLTKGYFVKLDDDDYDRVVALGRKFQVTKEGYARTSGKRGGVKFHTYLHRLVMSWKTGIAEPDLPRIDHENRDRLDCTRRNLRIGGNRGNNANRTAMDSAVPYIGVAKIKGSPNYRAYMSRNDKQIPLGVFPTPEMAAYARDLAVAAEYGEFANLNNVPPCELTPITSRAAGQTGLVGVKRHRNRFIARAKVQGVEHHIGSFATPEEAFAAREVFLQSR